MSYVVRVLSVEITSSEESSEEEISYPIRTHYPNMAEYRMELLQKYFQLLATLEHHRHFLDENQRIIDLLVDLCIDTNEDI